MSASSSSRGPCVPSPSKGSPIPRRPLADLRFCAVREIVRALAASITVMITLTTGAGDGSAAETASGRLEALGRVLRSRTVWSATYTQDYLPAGMTVGERDQGRVWVSWPDRAHFRAGDPVTRTMGMEGRHVRLLDLDVPSCDDHRMNDDEWARMPLAAVLDPQSAVDRFTILDIEGRGFALIPRQPGGVARVEVELGEDSLPTSVVIIDPQGATNSLVFENWASAEQPPGGQWLPEPPAPIECLAGSDREPGF